MLAKMQPAGVERGVEFTSIAEEMQSSPPALNKGLEVDDKVKPSLIKWASHQTARYIPK